MKKSFVTVLMAACAAMAGVAAPASRPCAERGLGRAVDAAGGLGRRRRLGGRQRGQRGGGRACGAVGGRRGAHGGRGRGIGRRHRLPARARIRRRPGQRQGAGPRGASGASMVVGTTVTVSVIGSGVVLSAAGEVLAFVPNAHRPRAAATTRGCHERDAHQLRPYEVEYQARSRARARCCGRRCKCCDGRGRGAGGLFLFPLNAHAGRSCEQRRPTLGIDRQGHAARGAHRAGARCQRRARRAAGARRAGPGQVRAALFAPGPGLQDRGRHAGAWCTSSTSAARRWRRSTGRGWASSSSTTSGATKRPGRCRRRPCRRSCWRRSTSRRRASRGCTRRPTAS